MAIKEIGPKEFDVTIKFGGGLNTRASESDIRDKECSSGENYVLDLENQELRPREYFDLAGTAAGGQINGFAQLKKSDGTISTLIQSGTTVYEWDGNTFTSKGSVATGAKIRGHLHHNWILTDKVLITDLAMVEPVNEWDGTTFTNVSFTGVTGDFIAKYCWVSKDIAHYANINSNATATPHLLCGSTNEDYATATIANKPSSALGAGDPWYMTQPDLRPINGLIVAFGRMLTSSEDGALYQITGSNEQDFAMDNFYPGSAASGDEAMAYIGNDIAYGRQGKVETLSGTAAFGDVETDDVSRYIANELSGLKDWTVVYNSRLSRVYFYAAGETTIYVLHKSIWDESRRRSSQLQAASSEMDISPWGKWTTQHSFNFAPTCMWTMFDPTNGLEYTWMGDSSGNVYRIEGSSAGDGGSANVKVSRTSKLYSVPLNADVFSIEGYVMYRKDEAATLTLSILFAGSTPMDENFTITFDALSGRPVYGGSLYYNDSNYYSTPFKGRFVRKAFAPAGQGTSFQVKAEVEGTTGFNISEIGLRLEATT
jgi:hypothetical protein